MAHYDDGGVADQRAAPGRANITLAATATTAAAAPKPAP